MDQRPQWRWEYMDNRIKNRLYHNHEKFLNSIVMDLFKQSTTCLESANWFWITLCHSFHLFKCSIYIIIIYVFLNVYLQDYILCYLFFLIFFIFFILCIIFIKKEFGCGFIANLLRLILVCNFPTNSLKLKRGVLPPWNKCSK